ncbi:hypothetical protein FACS1894162_4180 [Bacteroidia bacterium]|nr:hypothetical protein FACS1894162_4180 [Bacteroidia bacterium]
MTGSTAEIIKTAHAKYHSYDADWTKAYFDMQSGGYNVYHKDHSFSKKGGGGNAEKIVGIMLANAGKQVEFLSESLSKKVPDLRFDSQTWDIKFIEQANEETIRKSIRDARKADNAILYYTSSEKYLLLDNAIIREIGKFTKENRINELPNIYFIDHGNLKLFWKK